MKIIQTKFLCKSYIKTECPFGIFPVTILLYHILFRMHIPFFKKIILEKQRKQKTALTLKLHQGSFNLKWKLTEFEMLQFVPKYFSNLLKSVPAA